MQQSDRTLVNGAGLLQRARQPLPAAAQSAGCTECAPAPPTTPVTQQHPAASHVVRVCVLVQRCAALCGVFVQRGTGRCLRPDKARSGPRNDPPPHTHTPSKRHNKHTNTHTHQARDTRDITTHLARVCCSVPTSQRPWPTINRTPSQIHTPTNTQLWLGRGLAWCAGTSQWPWPTTTSGSC